MVIASNALKQLENLISLSLNFSTTEGITYLGITKMIDTLQNFSYLQDFSILFKYIHVSSYKLLNAQLKRNVLKRIRMVKKKLKARKVKIM